MKTSHTGSESETPAVALRRRAVGIARGKALRIPEDMESLSVEATRQMLHELRVHQIELEMQNEELCLAQEELNAAQARYFDLYDMAPVGYFTLSEQGLILEANLTAANLLGVARGALVKQPLPHFILPEDQDIYYRHSKLLFETHSTSSGQAGAPQVFELRLVKKDSAPVWVRIDSTLAKDTDGMPICRATMIDITERKQAEKALHVSEDKFAKAFQSSPDAFLLTSVPDGRITEVNDGAIILSGYSAEEMLGRTTTELGLWADPAARDAYMAEILREGRATNFETVFRVKSGAIINGMISGGIIHLRDSKCFLSVIRDVSDHKRAQDELLRLNIELEQRVMKRTAQLEAANKELEAFSYSVSHDLRAPLRAIDGFSHILMKEYTDRLDAEGVRLLNVILTNAKQMDQLITDMLSLSRVSKSDLQHAGIDMAAMAHSIYQEIASPEVRRKFGFSVAPLPDGDGDPVLLRHVWSNLLANAVKFTLPREERRIEISGHTEKGMNIYAVRDTGVGFNPNYVHKLFGIFQRLHKSSEFEGNGVGLAIVRRIVERHGGRVWAEGKINEGAAFFFSLPIKEVKDEPHE